jgi:hypothetical protein
VDHFNHSRACRMLIHRDLHKIQEELLDNDKSDDRSVDGYRFIVWCVVYLQQVPVYKSLPLRVSSSANLHSCTSYLLIHYGDWVVYGVLGLRFQIL